jgi:hypothetical protein
LEDVGSICDIHALIIVEKLYLWLNFLALRWAKSLETYKKGLGNQLFY